MQSSNIPGFLLVAGALGAAPVAAQIPQTFTNLQVLPEDTPRGELIGVMRSFAFALGVRCNYCHVGEDPANLEGYDFASDEKEPKRIARRMMRMREEINDRWLADLGRPQTLDVACATCHRGLARPVPLRDEIVAALDSAGVEAAIARYDSLRERYYGRAAYDFGGGPLNSITEQLTADGRLEEALAIIGLNIEHNPDQTYPYVLQSGVQAALGDEEAAIASLERALEIDPDSEFLQGRLERLRTPPP